MRLLLIIFPFFILSFQVDGQTLHSQQPKDIDYEIRRLKQMVPDNSSKMVYSQKTLIKTLQPIQQNIVNYIKSNKINTKNEAKLIDLMNFIDNQPN